MKVKTIINFVLVIILLSAVVGVSYYYLNLPVAKISKQHISDMSLIYKKVKTELEKPYHVGKKMLENTILVY